MGEADRLVQLFERLPESARGELIDFAEFLARKADPVGWALDHAPIDDEPLSDEERAAIAESEADLAAGRTIPLEQIEAELGL
jgi:hypothetical protein